MQIRVSAGSHARCGASGNETRREKRPANRHGAASETSVSSGKQGETRMRKPSHVIALMLLLVLLVLVVSAQANTPSNRTKPQNSPDYVGSDMCKTCHETQFQAITRTQMGKVLFQAPRNDLERRGCEACHGPGRSHIEALTGDSATPTSAQGNQQASNIGYILTFGKKSTASAATQNAACLQCHEQGLRMFWRGSPHESRGLTCATCHQAHVAAPSTRGEGRFMEPLADNRAFVRTTQMEVCFQCHKMRRAQLMRSSHMPFREGKVTCSSCHNPHGSPNPKQLIASTVNETCYSCHAERRGPFLWEHPPVMENCMNCHEAHGSTNTQLLKVRTPRLCQRCHIEARHPTTPQSTDSRFVFNRSCTNCHSQIHGSNHPSGVRFHR